MTRFPKISIVSCLYNGNLEILRQTLDGIKKQKYPERNIEHIVMDGGSEKRYLDILKFYRCRVLVRENLRNKALVRMKMGVENAKGDIILFLEPDNIILEKNWLSKMVEPFTHSNIVGTFSMYNTYTKDMPLVTKYSALIGVNDPLVYYLGKSEKMPRFENKYTLGRILSENRNYYIVKFDKTNLPTLGDNGHMVRRKLIVAEARRMKQFYHTDAFYNLALKGHDTYGVVKNSIVHHTGSSIISFFTKRTLYKSQFYDNNVLNRSYFVFNPHVKKDVINLMKFIFFSLTFIQTIYFSIKGFLRIREPAWFLHPIACILAVFFYGKSELLRRL